MCWQTVNWSTFHLCQIALGLRPSITSFDLSTTRVLQHLASHPPRPPFTNHLLINLRSLHSEKSASTIPTCCSILELDLITLSYFISNFWKNPHAYVGVPWMASNSISIIQPMQCHKRSKISFKPNKVVKAVLFRILVISLCIFQETLSK